MSGAKNCPETPRQKMIGMMYLVLTAMLALNVSADILNGFKMVSDSLKVSIESSNKRTESLFDDFEFANKQNPTKTKEWLDKAKEVQAESDKLYDYIQNFKLNILRMADGPKPDNEEYHFPNEPKNIRNQGDVNAPGNFGLRMTEYTDPEGKVQPNPDGKSNAVVLKENIEAYRDFMIAKYTEYAPKDSTGATIEADNNPRVHSLNELFATKIGHNASGEEIPWEESWFESMPVSAVISLLSKTQSDIRTQENEMIAFLLAQTDASDFRVNKIQALVVPKSSTVQMGDRYVAQIVLSAIDSTKTPEVTINGTKLGPDNIYEVPAGSAGSHKYSGQLSIIGNDGMPRIFPFESEYLVTGKVLAISNKDMNVVYRGIDNKFAISAGVPNEKLTVTAEGANVKKVGNEYIINPTRDGSIKIHVYADMDGKRTDMGMEEFRVKYLPDPKAFLSYTKDGMPKLTQDDKLSVKQIKAEDTRIVAEYGPDELLKAKFNVTSFSMVTKFGSSESHSGKLTGEQRSQIDRLRAGDIITFRAVKAVGADGKTRSLNVVSIQL